MAIEIDRIEQQQTGSGVPVVVATEVQQAPQQIVTPIVQEPVILREVHVPTVVQTVRPVNSVRTAYTRRFTPDAVVAASVGVVLLLIGLIAAVRAGFAGPMNSPVVQVLGFGHTTTLGLIEIAFGAALLLAGSTSSQSGALFFASVLSIGAFVGAVQTKSFVKPLALESSFAWLLVLLGVSVVLTSLLVPRYITRSTVVHSTSV